MADSMPLTLMAPGEGGIAAHAAAMIDDSLQNGRDITRVFELDARERALDERELALAAKERDLAARMQSLADVITAAGRSRPGSLSG